MEISNFSNLIALTSGIDINPSEMNLLASLLAKTLINLELTELGLRVQDLQNFILIVTFIRFFVYSSYYNVKTGFYIACINLFSALLWYIHLIFILKEYNAMNLTNSFSARLWISYVFQQDEIYKRNMLFQSANIIGQFFGNTDNNYRIDPLSMIFSIIPQPLKYYSDQIYYTLWDRVGPAILVFIAQNVFISKMAFLYLLVVRYGKRYCPYLIRWHWTFVMMYTIITPIFIKLPYRLEIFSQLVLLPEGRLNEFFYAKFLAISIITSHLLFIILPLFHALLGQYFFIPYLTRNVELHVGLRPKDSIYSGGYTAWQEYSIFLSEIGEEKKPIPLKLWWGWFGRGTEKLTSTKLQKNNLSIFGRLRKFLKNLFKRFKQ